MSTSFTFNFNKFAGFSLESANFPTFGGVYGA